MRSAILIGCLLWAVVYVQSLTRVERRASIQKRAASPQVYQGAQSNNWNQTQQFQWVKVNNQWVRRDGTNKLPGYSQPNIPYNQTGNQWNTPAPGRSPSPTQPGGQSFGNVPKPGQQTPQVTPHRQNSTSQGSIGWDPSADRALTQDLPKTTPRTTTTTTTTTTTRAPHTPTPIRAPFGSGMGGQQKPQHGRYNPDASLTYGGLPPQTNVNRGSVKPTPAGPPGSNPYGGLFN